MFYVVIAVREKKYEKEFFKNSICYMKMAT